jgi:hypothetical protein
LRARSMWRTLRNMLHQLFTTKLRVFHGIVQMILLMWVGAKTPMGIEFRSSWMQASPRKR